MLGKPVVLDTATPVVYLGVLASYDEVGFCLHDADVHHCDEGHASREQYITEAARDGIRANREQVFVMRNVVMSVSALSDVLKN